MSCDACGSPEYRLIGEASPIGFLAPHHTGRQADMTGGWCTPLTTRVKVRLEGAHHLWRKVPSGELSIDPEADERRGWATGLVEAS